MNCYAVHSELKSNGRYAVKYVKHRVLANKKKNHFKNESRQFQSLFLGLFIYDVLLPLIA